MSDPKTPLELRAQFKLIQGGLETGQTSPSISEEDVRAEPIGEILQKYYERLASQDTGFQMPDFEELSPEAQAELDYMASDPKQDEFDFTKGPFLIDPDP